MMSRKMKPNSLKIIFKYESVDVFGMSIGDLVFNVLHCISILLMPFLLKVHLFQVSRGQEEK